MVVITNRAIVVGLPHWSRPTTGVQTNGSQKVKKAFVPNGCGGKGGWVKPPDWIFYDDCCEHDGAYHEGGTEQDRLFADKLFLAHMLESVDGFARKPVKWYRKPGQEARVAFLKSQAWLYYRAVRLCGKKYFKYRKQ
jgi:hypothetical protein